MKLIPQNQSDDGHRFDIELVGHGRIAHVDAWGADDPCKLRNLFCLSPNMAALLRSLAWQIERCEDIPPELEETAQEARDLLKRL